MLAIDISLPPEIPARCVAKASADYQVPEIFLLAIIRHESRGNRLTVMVNKNGSIDYGAGGLNSGSWVPYFQKKYGIRPEDLMGNMCLAIRATAYALKWESLRPSCGGEWWCAVGNYHSQNRDYQTIYQMKIQGAIDDMVRKGRFR